jgi:hypothetical protein
MDKNSERIIKDSEDILKMKASFRIMKASCREAISQKFTMFPYLFLALVLFIIFNICSPGQALSAEVTLRWDPSSQTTACRAQRLPLGAR